MKNRSYNRVVVDLRSIVSNYLLMKEKMQDGHKMLAMIKADAYGHGAVECGLALQDVGCTVFGVAEVREGVRLRENGIVGEIFVMMGFTTDAVSLLFEYNLTPVVFEEDTLRLLSLESQKWGKSIACHIKVETGMGRLGFAPADVLDIANFTKELPGVEVTGLVSHLPEGDVPEAVSNERAMNIFSRLCKELKTDFKVVCHLASSGGVLNFADAHFDMGRTGICLFGYHPAGRVENELYLQPAMKFYSQVLQVREYEAGVGISYGLTYVTTKKTKIAVLPVGYEDGYTRALSNKAQVLIKGKRAPVCGRICMNICMVDVTDIEDVRHGDEVVLLGDQGEDRITADDLAEWAGTISYEILCMIGHANIRKYIK